MSKKVLFVLAALFSGVSAASAQCPTDCSYQCNSGSSSCDMSCTENCSTDSTCGQYGVCNYDPDGDNVYWPADNCGGTYNPNQANCDGDSLGNVCDPLNANYQQYSAWQTCYIVDRSHFGYMDQTNWREAVFRDASSCGAPDQVRNSSLWGYCTGYFPPSYAQSCCWSLWGPTTCTYLRNNQCTTVN